MHAKRYFESPQNFIDGGHVPRGIAKFTNIFMAREWQGRQELRQPFSVYVPVGRQLEKNRPHLFPQDLHAGQERLEGGPGVAQPLDVCDKAASLHGETEAAWSLFSPALYRGRFRQAIKAVIDLDCIEVSHVPIQIF